MGADNTLYDRDWETWWSGKGHLSLLAMIVPARLRFLREVCDCESGLELAGKRVLDVGCGGGLFSEELARLGCDVTGIDPSQESIRVAREHAEESRLDIDYHVGRGEELPFEDATFDVVVCCDVLEHVDDLARVMAQTVRVLRPGGLYVYDTVNRNWVSKLFLIHLFQEWSATNLVPPGLHDWERFIKPHEMDQLLQEHGLRPIRRSGMAPDLGPLVSIRRLRDLHRLKKGTLDHATFAEGMLFDLSPIELTNYIGAAVKEEQGRGRPSGTVSERPQRTQRAQRGKKIWGRGHTGHLFCMISRVLRSRPRTISPPPSATRFDSLSRTTVIRHVPGQVSSFDGQRVSTAWVCTRIRPLGVRPPKILEFLAPHSCWLGEHSLEDNTRPSASERTGAVRGVRGEGVLRCCVAAAADARVLDQRRGPVG